MKNVRQRLALHRLNLLHELISRIVQVNRNSSREFSNNLVFSDRWSNSHGSANLWSNCYNARCRHCYDSIGSYSCRQWLDDHSWFIEWSYSLREYESFWLGFITRILETEICTRRSVSILSIKWLFDLSLSSRITLHMTSIKEETPRNATISMMSRTMISTKVRIVRKEWRELVGYLQVPETGRTAPKLYEMSKT